MTNTKQVCIIGVGYVGEHLVEVFSKKYKVIGYDVSPDRVNLMKKRFINKSNVTIQSSINNINDSDLFCISVPTLLKNDKTIDTSYVDSAVNMLSNIAKNGSTIVMESSVSVGMTRSLLGEFRKKNIYIGFSPERVDPGRIEPAADKIPKIISGVDMESLENVDNFYNTVFDKVVKVSSTETAEMCKLYENCFRMINIAYINEISDNCQKLGIDVYEMVKACSSKPYGYMPFYPSLGVGGHCIPVNPFYLFTNNSLPLLAAATTASLERPKQKAHNFMNDKKILVVGLAFKPGESYTMNSPGLEFANELIKMGKDVVVYDPLIDHESKPVSHLKFLDSEKWDSDYIIKNFTSIVIAIKQTKIDYNILNNIKENMSVYKFCDV